MPILEVFKVGDVEGLQDKLLELEIGVENVAEVEEGMVGRSLGKVESTLAIVADGQMTNGKVLAKAAGHKGLVPRQKLGQPILQSGTHFSGCATTLACLKEMDDFHSDVATIGFTSSGSPRATLRISSSAATSPIAKP
ncbi:hypothetical protein L7F22_012277 [Adiantum nelumboides]|nr:hypothetical protein [Adiantum nelumboides]